MTAALPKVLTLEQFLAQPETQPATEYIDGQILQKPMPRGKHSRLQFKLSEKINDAAEPTQTALALPELRCTFNNRSIVPDIAVFVWSRIPFDADGEVPNIFNTYPDWIIEILSSDQSQTRVTDNILFSIEHGTQLGWLIDPGERVTIGYQPNQLPKIYGREQRLPILVDLELSLSVEQLFSWLKVN
ncbi:MAG: Uma2 family endonuclease [Cyanobacteria bacterium J06648_16]